METTQTVPAPVNDSSGFGAGDDLSFLDDPANLVGTGDLESDGDGDRTTGDTETPVPAADNDSTNEEESPAQTASEGIFKGIKPAVVAILKHLAKQEALDLENPRDFKVARMIAEKENRIRELSLAQEPPEGARSYLDAFRDPSLPETPAQGQRGQQEIPPPAPAYRQMADTWQDEAAFYEDYMDAMELPEGPEKPVRLSNCLFGFVDVAMRSQHLPAILSMVNQVIDARVGPAVRQADEVREAQQVRGTIDTLAKQEGFEDIESLFEPASDGALDYQGKQIADTWVNRAVIAFPHILKIHVEGRTPAETKRLTSAEQYAAAHTVMKAMRSQSSDPSTLNRGVATGIAIERSKRDRVRQGLNAGKTNGAQNGDRVFDDILKANDGTTSFASVFK